MELGKTKARCHFINKQPVLFEELMPDKAARRETSPQHSSKSLLAICLVLYAVLIRYPATKDSRITNNILCMVKKKH